jgi:ribosomal protein S13
LHVVAGVAGLAPFERGGLEPLEATEEEFVARLRLENHTLKRALTDPRLFSGIGNSYSDEILHRARLSPLRLTRQLGDEEAARLREAVRTVLTEWTDRLRLQTGDGFPEKVTAFREGMAVHGRFRQPCPICGTPIQRIRYAENETNYCPSCQTEGRLLADRGLSRLLREDWPRSLEEMEDRLKSCFRAGLACRVGDLPGSATAAIFISLCQMDALPFWIRRQGSAGTCFLAPSSLQALPRGGSKAFPIVWGCPTSAFTSSRSTAAASAPPR